jgi:uncharacterized protein
MINRKESKWVDRLSWFLTRHRGATIIATLAIMAVFVPRIGNIKGDIILQHMFPYNHPYLQLHARFAAVFGSGASGVAIALKAGNGNIFTEANLLKLQQMTNEITMWPEVYRNLTVSIASRSVKVVKTLKKGEIQIEPMMWPKVPQNQQQMDQLKWNVFSDAAYNGTLVSNDGTAAMIFSEFKENISYEKAFTLLQGLIHKYSDQNISIHVVGYPVIMGWIYSYKHQILLVFAASIAFMLLILFITFRNFAGMVAPLLFSVMCTCLGLGFIGWTGINFSPLLYVVAFLVSARVVSHSVQVTCRYLEELEEKEGDRIQACYETIRRMYIPNVAAITTEAAGFLILILAQIALMQQVAIIMSFWMLSIGLCGIVTPTVCSYLPLHTASGRWSKDRKKADLLDGICMSLAKFSIGSGKYIVGSLVVVFMVLSIWLAGNLKVGDPTSGTPLLWPSHQYNRDQELIDRTFNASSENFMLFYEGAKGSVYDPTVLNTFEEFNRYMRDSLPDIYKSSSSLGNLIKMVNVTFHDGDKAWYQLPRNMPLLMGFIGYTRENTDRGTLSRFIDSTLERSQVTLFFSDHKADNLIKIREAAYDFFKKRPSKIDTGEFKLAGGRIGLEMAVNEEIKRSHVIIDSMVLGVIFILCSLFYYSLIAGLMLTFPLIMANMVAFAYMALNNIGLSINTLPVAAIGVGVGVDFAIYIYSRCTEELHRHEGRWEDAILMSVRTSGKAVIYTGLTMILPILSWCIISDLKFQAQMGIFLAMILATNVLLALTLHPLLIHVIKPHFLLKNVVLSEDSEREQVLGDSIAEVS